MSNDNKIKAIGWKNRAYAQNTSRSNFRLSDLLRPQNTNFLKRSTLKSCFYTHFGSLFHMWYSSVWRKLTNLSVWTDKKRFFFNFWFFRILFLRWSFSVSTLVANSFWISKISTVFDAILSKFHGNELNNVEIFEIQIE